MSISIPNGEFLPIESVRAVVESASAPPKSAPVTLVASATCFNIVTGCTTRASLSAPTGSGITAISPVTVPAALAPGYRACVPSPCVLRGTGYGTDPLLGFGYETTVPGTGYVLSDVSSGYGYPNQTLTLNFTVTVSPSALGAGNYWLTFMVNTGSSILGQVQSKSTHFAVTAPTGGGGGGGVPSGISVVATIVGNTATASITGAAGQAVTITLGTVNGLQLGTLTFTLGMAVTNAQVTVTVSSTPTEGATAIPAGFGSFLYLSINIPAGAASGGAATLTFTLTSAQLAGNAPATVTMLHFFNNVWQAQPTSVTTTNADGSASFSAILSGFSPFAIAFDTAPPTITNLRPPEGAGATTRPLIAASLVDNRGINTATGRMTVDGQVVQATVTANEILYTPPVALTLGTHAVRVDVTDLSGFSANRTWSFNAAAAADDQPPTVTAVSPARDGFTNNPRPTIEASFSDNLGIDTTKVTATLDGAPAVGPTITATSVRFTPAVGLTDGKHTVTVTVADTSGNSNFATWTFTVDTVLPIISAVKPDEGSTVGSKPTFEVTCSDALAGVDTSKLRITLDGVAVSEGSATFTPSTDLKEGAHTATAECSDLAGNTASRTWSFNSTPAPGAFPWLIVLVLVILVVVAGAGYWWYTNKGPGKKP